MKLALLALLATAAEAVHLTSHTVAVHKAAHKYVPNKFAQTFNTVQTRTKQTDKEVFDTFDLDNSGEIDFEEFLVFCAVISEEDIPKEAEPALQEIFNSVDANGSGGIDFDEAMTAVNEFEEE